MANGTVTYTLKFNADTTQAKKELQSLQESLTKVISSNKLGSGVNKEISDAISKVNQLRGILASSINSFGVLDLTKFNAGLKEAGLNVSQLQGAMNRLGATNEFNQLAGQIINANANVKILQGSVAKFFNGLKNTAAWTIQSNAIHAVQSALQGAYSYAQQLNKGLTDIAIVSDLGTEQLTKFARTANKMAQELSSSTADYVSGALIYYQAGLSDEEVIERTNTTIKLAQTSGETAESISSYMTAIWNNFYDGSKSVEYYADAISYLGAKTAASNADIAEGMQAFSAIANTVGLSFEYGASALTLLRDITQQSASTIGNSLKTIFARLSSVAQGDTLEDGVDLTKYSKALDQVGVSVLNATGDLRQMDDILDDLGKKWDNLTDAQKVALAQTVGGVRQYNNLISLMDNYEKFQELVQDSSNSTGYLQYQADIYADSWEGAKNRVTAAWQELYSLLLDDKFFIKLTNFLEKSVNFISDIIKGMGGLKGLIPTFISLFTSINPTDTALGLEKVTNQVLALGRALTGWTSKNNAEEQTKWFQAMTGNITSKTDNPDILEFASQQDKLIQAAVEARLKGEDAEATRLDGIIQRNQSLLDLMIKQASTVEDVTNKYEDIETAAENATVSLSKSDTFNKLLEFKTNDDIEGARSFLYNIKTDPSAYGFNKNSLNKWLKNSDIDNLTNEIIDKILASMRRSLAHSVTKMQNAAGSEAVAEAEKEAKQQAAKLTKEVEQQGQAQKNVKIQVEETGEKVEEVKEKTEQGVQTQEAWEILAQRLQEDFNLTKEEAEKLAQALLEAKNINQGILNQKTPQNWSVMATSALSAVGAIGSLNGALDGLIDNFTSGSFNLTSFASSLTSAGFAINRFAKIAEIGFGKAAVILSIVIGAIRLLSWGLTELNNWLTSFNIETKIAETKSQLVELGEEINNLTQETRDFKSTMESLASTTETISKMEKGTAEYTRAVAEANFETQKLIDKYKLNSDQYYRDENGLLQINQNGQNYINNNLNEKTNNAQNAYLAQQNILNTQQQTADFQKIYEKSTKGWGLAGQIGGGVTGGAAGGGLGYLLGGLIGAAIGATASGATGFTTLLPAIMLGWSSGSKIGAGVGGAAGAYTGQMVGKTGGESFSHLLHSDINALSELVQNGKISFIDDKETITATLEKEFGWTSEKIDEIFNDEELLSALQTLSSDVRQADDSLRTGIENNLIGNLYGNKDFDALTKEQQEWFVKQYGQDTVDRYKKLLKDENLNITDNDREAYALARGWTEEEGQWYNTHNDKVDLNDIQEDNLRSFVALNQAIDETTQKIENNGIDVSKMPKYGRSDLSDYDIGRSAFSDEEKESADRYAEVVKKIHDAWEDVGYSEKEASKVAEDLSEDYINFNKGYKDILDNYENYIDILKTADKTSMDYIDTLAQIKQDLTLMFDVPSDALSQEFLESAKTAELLKQAALGDLDAITELRETAATDILVHVDLDENAPAEVKNAYNSLLNEITNSEEWNDLEVGVTLNDEAFIEAINEMLESGAIAADEMNNLLDTIGWEPTIEYQPMRYADVKNTHKTVYTQDSDGNYSVVEMDSKLQDDDTVYVPKLISEKTHWKGSPQKITSQANRQKGASNAKSSGGGSSKKPKTADTERYHEINSKLEQTAHYLDMVNTAEDRAYGQKKLDLMDEKIKLLEREAEQYKQLYDEAKRYYDQDRDRLQNQYGAAFNADGSIANYDAWYKQFVDRYNAGGMDDDAWSAFEDAIKKYEDSLKHLNDAEKKYQDDLNKIFDQKLEKIEYRLKTITDLIKLDMDYLDYMIEMLDDDGLDTAEAMAYIAKEIADVTDQYTANKQALADIFKNHEGITDDLISGLYNGTVSVQQFIDTVGNFTEKEIESIKSIMSSMYSNGKDLKKYIEDLYGKLGELSDKFQESLDKQIDKLDHMNDIIDKTRNIIDVMGKDTLGISDELLDRMQRAQIEIGKEHLATLIQERDQYKLWIEQLEAQYAAMDPDSLEAKAIKEQIEAYQKVYEKVENEILDTTNMTAEQIHQRYIALIEQTVTEAGNKIAGAVGDFEKLMDAYDRQKDLDNLYLKTYEKTYQTNKLLRDIGKSLDDTANLGTQGKLRDLQEEILGYQQEGKQVTEEQMEERRKYYELLLAEAALEEAQNAKNMVRMTRDNEGNWSYTYTADQGKLDDLMNDYNDKLFAYEDYNQKTLESAQDTLLNLQNEYLEALKNARDEAEVQALQAYYEPMIEHQRNMVDYMLMRNNELADNFNVNADEVATKLDDTVYGITTGFDSMDEAMATFDEAMRIAKDNVIAYLQKMDTEQIALANSVGITAPEVEHKLDDIEQGVKDVHTAVAGDGTDENPGIAKDFDNEFNDALDTLKGFHETMGPIIDGIIEDIGKINNKVTEVISAYSELSGVTITPPDLSGAIGAMNALKAAADGAREAMRNASNSNNTNNSSQNSGIASGAATGVSAGIGNIWAGGGGGGQSTARNKNVMAKMATGGYTGAFGPEGRMAILHEKELVLNKADTQNLLTTVSFVRDLTRMISLNAADASSGLGNLFMGEVGQGGGYLDQTVTIHAEFPNATNHSEIEEAFSNLIGLASQYAGRKK